MNLKILTFNWHEPYICLMAHTGYEFHILEPEIQPGQRRQWDWNMRPLPKNGHIVSEAEARQSLENGEYAVVIAHNLKDLAWAQQYDLPKIAVFHNKFSTEAALSGNSVEKQEYFEFVQDLTHDAHRIFISKSKRDDWGLQGDIIRPGLPLEEYGGYHGNGGFLVRVANHLMERDLMLGYRVSREIVDGFPCVTLGQNPHLPDARLSRGFEDLLDHYRRGRMFLNTTVDGYEDGYNLSMLEAMATGMPVITTSNATSPIEDGVNGFISDDIMVLRRRVEDLLRNPLKAQELGQQARNTVDQLFPMKQFIRNWKQAVQTAIDLFLARHEKNPKAKVASADTSPRKRNVLLDTNGNPVTTAHYLERALRKTQQVITCGSAFTIEHKKNWNMDALHWPANQPDMSREPGAPVRSVLSNLPKGWQPDVYIYVETGLNTIPGDLNTLTIPKVCYLIDTHLNLDHHLQIARPFDLVFLAQKEYVARFREAGMEWVEWLPLACDPEIHGKQDVAKRHDVGFVGSILPTLPRRKQLLDSLAQHFNVHKDRRFMDEMAAVFSQSRVVFNNAVNNDLNMPVFEALCSGSLLVTDAAPGSGLAELFEDGTHLAIYDDASIVDTVRYYLDHPEEAERMAAAGRREVLARHTYDHRVQVLMQHVEQWIEEAAQKESAIDSAVEPVPAYFRNVRQDLLPLVPETAQSILEVGCGAGGTGYALKQRQNATVVGIEMNPGAAEAARKVLDDVVEDNIETMTLPFEENSFDCILFADVLEHLVEPGEVLKKTRPYLKQGGVMIASIPNIQYHGILHQLSEGSWTYQDEGILDRTHLRFFTLKEIEKLFSENGYDIQAVEENIDSQYESYAASGRTSLKTGRVTVSDLSPEELRRFFVIQYKIVARPVFNKETKPLNASEDTALDSNMERLKEARKLERSGALSEVLQRYQALCREDSQSSDAWVGQGNVLIRSGNSKEAEGCYRRAISIDEAHAGAWLGLGGVALQSGNWHDAVAAYEVILSEDAINSKALCGMGVALEHLDQATSAHQYYTNALKSDPENKAALASLINLSYLLNNFIHVEEFLGRFVKQNPTNLNLLFGLAGVQYKSGKRVEARKNLETILRFDANNSDAHTFLEKLDAENLKTGKVCS
ncbi:glycosyltransferase family protein [Nitrospina watsonii]|uniref:Spore protein YkvP/CgeB glycosyl transferase-like domain-containing protein n=1 Tax=Nitrospina watsonii TaxID=1323948 RepID=A0ABM9HE96_9BACT|nr:glycosyltransferase [Nitrospina watsonii]CAI2718397.1 conserved protein of unknown function [Nitrospina watsonii]